jgi:plastocyanin
VTCGELDDGCEGTLACGTCGEGEACNAGTCEANAPAFVCEATQPECTEDDFAAKDMTTAVPLDLVAFAPYAAKCLRVQVGQAVTIAATESHPFEKVCAEDEVLDSQDGGPSPATCALKAPGYDNYTCLIHPAMVGNPRRALRQAGRAQLTQYSQPPPR